MSLEKDTVIMPLPEGSEIKIERKIRALAMHNLFRTSVIIFLLPEGKDRHCSEAIEASRIAQEAGMEPMFVKEVPQPVLSDETGPLGWGYFSIPALSREGILKHWDVFVKWVDGSEVEFYSGHLGRWEPTGSPVFCPELEYRASEQIVAWANVFDDGTVEFFMSEDDARKYSEDAVRVGVKVREVQ